jgi:gamma-glutamyltranspeptidase/glutathione hydrolase
MDYVPRPHVSQHWQLTKPAVTGRRGIVVAQARSAAEAGVAILQAGGNAVDAAVGTAFALAAVEPWNSGLGGVGFALVHRAGKEGAEVVDFGPVAPRGLNPAAFRLTGRPGRDLFPWPEVEAEANLHGPLSFVIPGSVAGLAAMHTSHGRLPLADVMAPAIALARRGLPQDWFTCLKITQQAALLRRYPESARVYLPSGLPPVPPYQGSPGFLPLGHLQATLEHLARVGLNDFYEGDIAATIVADVRAMGGVISGNDLYQFRARIGPAVEVPWRGGRTWELATGLTSAPTLARVLEDMRDASWRPAPSTEWYVRLAKALKAAYAERLAGLGESEPNAAESCTSHLTVCDAEGSMVALTTTLLSSMGSRVVLPGTGILMNNGVMWFDPRPGRANSIAAGRRPLTNMCPVIVREAGLPVLAGGASGGRRILSAVFQTFVCVAEFGMSLDEAAHLPRIDVSDPDKVSVDSRMAPEVVEALRETGPVEVLEHSVVPVNFACPNLIVQTHSGARGGISDAVSPWSAAVAEAS